MTTDKISISKTGKFEDKFYSTIWYFNWIVLSSFYYKSEGRFAKPLKKSLAQNFIFIDPRCLREKAFSKTTFLFGIKLLCREIEDQPSLSTMFSFFKSTINTKHLIQSNNSLQQVAAIFSENDKYFARAGFIPVPSFKTLNTNCCLFYQSQQSFQAFLFPCL